MENQYEISRGHDVAVNMHVTSNILRAIRGMVIVLFHDSQTIGDRDLSASRPVVRSCPEINMASDTCRNHEYYAGGRSSVRFHVTIHECFVAVYAR